MQDQPKAMDTRPTKLSLDFSQPIIPIDTPDKKVTLIKTIRA